MKTTDYLKRLYRYVRYGEPTIKQNYTQVVVKQISPNNMLLGRNIIVSGGGRGLGFYIAKKCLDEGANVIISGRNKEHLLEAQKRLGDKCRCLVHDVSMIDNNIRFFEEAERILGKKADSLIACAGVSFHEGNFRNVTPEDWDGQMDVNLKGNFFLIKDYICYLEGHEDKAGNIVMLTSERGKRPDDIPYGLTKVASNSFIQAIASKVIEEGIRLNAVAPGVTASDMTGFKKDGNLYADWQINKRIYVPEEVAEVVNFLLCEVSACINGEIITCNEGKHISHW